MSTQHTHPEIAAAFVADAAKAKRHDDALWFVREKRDRAAATLPEWEQLRTTAAAIKAHTMARLGMYLEEFERNAQRNGIRVHWAADGDEHNRIVHEILKSRGVKRLVKSKSMLTEECGLNPYLEAQGIEVVDTDLGERIVQLRKEGPSHIVMPAIHLSKTQIGELFEKELGTPAGESDPTRLTYAARLDLRNRFLKADAGLTGVNFAVAETGGVVVCTNEGNADMGTHLPPIHIACMGMEKIIPRAKDLAVFLRILARSGTGQPITVYSSHFNGPVAGGEMHVVIVDNGRSGILAQEKYRRSLTCIRCGACLNTCPVFRRSGGYSYGYTISGPIGSLLGPLRQLEEFSSLPHACSLCGSCSDVCPVKVDLHHELYTIRQDIRAKNLLPWSKRVQMAALGKVLSREWSYRWAGKLARAALRWLPHGAIYNPLNAWGRQRELPKPPKKSFREMMDEEADE